MENVTMMALFKNVCLATCVFVLIVSLFLNSLFSLLTSTNDEVEVYYGSWGLENDASKGDTKVYEFRINLTQRDIDTINLHLNLSRGYSPPVHQNHHEYGINPYLLEKVTNFLKDSYPIKDRLRYVNQHPQYITKIQGLNIHFVRITPSNVPEDAKVVPALLLHGWPSSALEYYKMAPIISEKARNEGVHLELIVPSLPGFGYSDAPAKAGGLEAKNIANVLDNLMERLGHDEYYVHGNDWGAVVATNMATLFPERVKGFHSNFCISLRRVTLLKMGLGSLAPSWVAPRSHVGKLYPLWNLLSFYVYETGYMHIQGTKPDTIGVGLDSSLEALLAFTLEKLTVAADKNNINLDSAGIEAYDLTTLLDDLIFYYWLPKKSTTAARIYKENLSPAALLSDVNNLPIDQKVACGCVFFEHEFVYQPEHFLKDKYTNLAHYKTFPIGGHFVALENEASKLLAVDLGEFIVKVENATNSFSR